MPDDGERAGEGTAAGVPTHRRCSRRFSSVGASCETVGVPESTSSPIGPAGPAGARDEDLIRADGQPLLSLIADLERELDREGLASTLRTRVAVGLERMKDLLDAVHAGNVQLVHELIEGTVREDGTKRPDGLAQILPRWARGTATLEALQGIVVVDESQQPVAVTVHWERVPVKLRPAAPSLASEYVDAYRDRPKGGRPPKSKKLQDRN